MTEANEKLARALLALKTLQDSGKIAIRTADLSRTYRERLLNAGFLTSVIKGWYIASDPDSAPGDTTAWYTSFWRFCGDYLEDRLGDQWCLAPENALLWHAGHRAVPDQLIVRSPQASNNLTTLLHDTSILDVRAALPARQHRVVEGGLRLYSRDAALVSASPSAFLQWEHEIRALLAALPDASGLLTLLLGEGRTEVAGRLAGALRSTGRPRLANTLLETMTAVGHDVRESNPFGGRTQTLSRPRERSPYVQRMASIWREARGEVSDIFEEISASHGPLEEYLKLAAQRATLDAYHSLSIEGYRVTVGLIERIRSGQWDPAGSAEDRERRAALAARGYLEARRRVDNSIRRVFEGENCGEVARSDHGSWFQAMFAPGVRAGLHDARDLAGYRSSPVFIRGSRYVPPGRGAVRDLMPAFFDLLEEEDNAAARIVLGHFFFVWIHPYPDGNGRLGRFLMNLMMAAGGYQWTVIPVEARAEYMGALERASVHSEFGPFARLIARCMTSQGP